MGDATARRILRNPYIAGSDPYRNLMPSRPNQRRRVAGGISVFDLIVIVIGTGGILLMAGYAVLCERI